MARAGTALLALVTCQRGGTELRPRGEPLCSSLAAVAPTSLVLGPSCSPPGQGGQPSGQPPPHAVRATCNLGPAIGSHSLSLGANRSTAGVRHSAGGSPGTLSLAALRKGAKGFPFLMGTGQSSGPGWRYEAPAVAACGTVRSEAAEAQALPWVCPLAALGAVPWASCDAQCHSWKERRSGSAGHSGFAYVHGGEAVQGARAGGDKHAGSGRWASRRTRDSSSWGHVTRLLCGSPSLWCVVVWRGALAWPPCSVPWQQRVAETPSAGLAAVPGRCGGSAEERWLRRRGQATGQGPGGFEAIGQAGAWVRAGEVGLLVEQGWVWSASECFAAAE